jgi:hypothetical protein
VRAAKQKEPNYSVAALGREKRRWLFFGQITDVVTNTQF